jgi:hypothetical protein
MEFQCVFLVDVLISGEFISFLVHHNPHKMWDIWTVGFMEIVSFGADPYWTMEIAVDEIKSFDTDV